MFKCEINTDTPAFKNPKGVGDDDFNKRVEITRILREVEMNIAKGLNGGNIMDITGNNVGFWEI